MFTKTDPEVASKTLFDYFLDKPSDAIFHAKECLAKLRDEWKGEGGSAIISKETFNWLWSLAKPAQLNNLEIAYNAIQQLSDVTDPQNGLSALNIVVDLFNKSVSKNWSIASLNNRLATQLLLYSGRITSDVQMLATNDNGVLFVSSLYSQIRRTQVRFNEANTIYVHSPSLDAALPSIIDSYVKPPALTSNTSAE
ncbi:MAG TPA: hypothetical protein VLG38_05535, partial [Gammaproteobacteria bacterium]|nr:hypothetical protein [Gammaproteobacteria bacterium]